MAFVCPCLREWSISLAFAASSSSEISLDEGQARRRAARIGVTGLSFAGIRVMDPRADSCLFVVSSLSFANGDNAGLSFGSLHTVKDSESVYRSFVCRL